jgi:hypothetical protein
MWQLFASTSVILSLASYFLYQENQSLKDEAALQSVKIAEQAEAFQVLESKTRQQQQSLLSMEREKQAIQLEMNRYLDIFARHNLTRLAAAKPGLIETRANNATREVFETIENDTRDIDVLDDGLQLAPEGTGSNNSDETGQSGDSSASASSGSGS